MRNAYVYEWFTQQKLVIYITFEVLYYMYANYMFSFCTNYEMATKNARLSYIKLYRKEKGSALFKTCLTKQLAFYLHVVT